MLLKIMSGESVPDSDSRKMFRLYDNVACVEFDRPPGKDAVAIVLFDDNGDPEEFPVPGNAYVMNEHGVTVASFGAAKIPA